MLVKGKRSIEPPVLLLYGLRSSLALFIFLYNNPLKIEDRQSWRIFQGSRRPEKMPQIAAKTAFWSIFRAHKGSIDFIMAFGLTETRNH
ncbi:hypothetical protein V2K62_12610 [Pseudomonas alliivorans]|nr:hypothetical protein [Pseudomonas alliivorans]MEE4741486.1 hypothetical protein [Pseudomonas alliivorans]MEE4818608.1 hypothetical protein [Pseudomonas alliivorans]MEE4834710.1 hypothetical protein [Pseudomonas alliivorans]MEE4925532.1 hypothetical protein [Pseudomonas alliivorans]